MNEELLNMVAMAALEAIRRETGGRHEEESIQASGGR